MIKKIAFLFVVLLLFPCFAFSARLYPEAYYQNKWCADKGIIEYALNDMTRVDCLTDTEAVEFDFANKWAECIGQALYYGLMTNKTPVCALIMEHPQDERYLKRLNAVADKYGIKVYEIRQ